MSWKLNSSGLVYSLRLASWCCLLAGISLVGYGVGTSYVRTWINRNQNSLNSSRKWLISNVLFPIFRAIDAATFESELLNRLVISVIFVVLLVVAMIAKGYAMVRR